MRKHYLPFGLLTLFLGLCLLVTSVLPASGQSANQGSMIPAGSYWETVRANQYTGTVNPIDVLNARAQLQEMRGDAASSSMSLNWTSVGPDNYSGLSWTVIFDTRDASKQTLIAGSAAGGFWKSMNFGLTWEPMSVAGTHVPRVSSMVQGNDGVIYAATGVTSCKKEKYPGNGIYKLDNSGVFQLIASTASNPDFTGVTKIAMNKQTGRLYAATKGGLYYSENGNDWTKILNGYAMDVCVGPDGSVLAAAGDSAYLSVGGNTGSWVTLTTGKAGFLPKTGIGWMTFAIAPSDANIMYACLTNTDGKLLNLYNSIDKGASWSIIFPANPAFEPFGSTTGYGCYSNTMTVFPNDPNQVLLGGINMWWGKKVLATGYYNWEQVSFGSLSTDIPFYAPQYHHSYSFRPGNDKQLVIASDGGVTVGTFGEFGLTFQTSNKNMKSAQFNAVANSAETRFVMGGGDRIGTLAFGYFYPTLVNTPASGYQVYRIDAASQPGNYAGNGGTCVWSSIDSKVAVFTKQRGAPPIRRQEMTDLIYDNDIMTGEDGKIDTVKSAYIPMHLWESFNFTQTRDSVKVYARIAPIPAGTTITVESSSSKFPFLYTTPVDIPLGDSLMVADPIATRFFYFGAKANIRGIYMTKDLLKFNKVPDYYTLFTAPDTITAITVSPDLNTLWAGTELGKLIRITGLVNAYDSATGNIGSSQCVLIDTLFSETPFKKRHVTSISINPKNTDQVLVTLGNYGNNDYVYFSNNAGSASPVFTSVQSNLPKVPVFAGLIEMQGNGTAILGTDLGVFSTANLFSGSPQWTADGAEVLGDVLITGLKQQTIKDYHVENYGVIYMSSYGRGLWMDTTYRQVVGIEPVYSSKASGSLALSPNPANDVVNFTFQNVQDGMVYARILDLAGRIVKEQSFGFNLKGVVTGTLNVQNLPAGSYLVKVGELTAKLIKY